MKQKITPIEMFVPALALENLSNPAPATLTQKIKWAVMRYHQVKDFNARVHIQSPMPFVHITSFKLNQGELGYNIVGYIRSG